MGRAASRLFSSDKPDMRRQWRGRRAISEIHGTSRGALRACDFPAFPFFKIGDAPKAETPAEADTGRKTFVPHLANKPHVRNVAVARAGLGGREEFITLKIRH
jgi:hypothetical protein